MFSCLREILEALRTRCGVVLNRGSQINSRRKFLGAIVVKKSEDAEVIMSHERMTSR